jgi:hypothetical protein
MSLEDVTEASAKIASQALEAAIVETQSRFSLDSRSLKQLANAKVPANVIDLMVAQSFPSHFRVERPMTTAPASNGIAGGTTVVVGSSISVSLLRSI